MFFANFKVLASLSAQGSDQSKSHKKPYNGGSINLSILLISSTVYKSGEIPPCMQR
jgi:hypothetical protein